MSARQMRLPEVPSSTFTTVARLPQEWVTDAPWISSELLSQLTKAQLTAIYKVKAEGLAKVAALQSQIDQAYSETFEKIGRSL